MDRVRDLIRQSRVLDFGPLPAPRPEPAVTVHQALQFLVRGRRGAIVIVEGMRPVGILTERDVLYKLADGTIRSRERTRRTPVEAVMSRPPVTIPRRTKLYDAIETMDRLRHRHLIVVDRHGDLKGLLTTSDLVQFLTDQFPEDTVNLPPRLR